MSEASELKPCPFCGPSVRKPVLHKGKGVKCHTCGAWGPAWEMPDGSEWNRRADLTPTPSVTVKPLEWGSKELTDNDQYSQKATSSIGIYVATDVGWFIIGLSQWHDAHDIDAAKAAAQADYEARILSAIQVAPRRATPDALATLKSGEGFATSGAEARWIEDMKAGVYDESTPTAQCCMCGKTGLRTAEDGGPECELHDGRWVCSSDCYEQSLGWQPIETAPHDRDILVWYDHNADPYQDPENPKRLTPYATWADGGDCLFGKGFCIARYHPREWFSEDEYGEGYFMPAAWFAHEGNDYERAVNPLFWKPLDVPLNQG